MTRVELNAPDVAVAPPDKPEVAEVVIVTPVISPETVRAPVTLNGLLTLSLVFE